MGEHGIYFDPFDIDSIINVLESSLNNSSDLVKSLNLTSKRCKLFTVQKSVSETHDCYKKILATRKKIIMGNVKNEYIQKTLLINEFDDLVCDVKNIISNNLFQLIQV